MLLDSELSYVFKKMMVEIVMAEPHSSVVVCMSQNIIFFPDNEVDIRD
jgi:hypothetical protein